MPRILCLTDDPALCDVWLPRCQALHTQLRPAIPGDYVPYLQSMFDEGAQMAVLVDDTDTPRALAVFRINRTTYVGQRFYVDDLVTDAASRGQGWGGQMIDWLEARARQQGCDMFALDSGTHRTRAHKFYFTKGLVVSSFAFSKPLD